MARKQIAIHESITQDRIVELVQQDDNVGLCLACGAEAYDVEPDGRKGDCEVCGEEMVFGASEVLIMVVP